MVEQQQAEPDNPLMRKKKTPEELAAEAELEDQDEFTSEYFNLFLPISNESYQECIGIETLIDYHRNVNELSMKRKFSYAVLTTKAIKFNH